MRSSVEGSVIEVAPCNVEFRDSKGSVVEESLCKIECRVSEGSVAALAP